MQVHVILVGSMGVGKSTVARGLAACLGWPVRDSDDDLRATWGFTARELAATAGLDVLHRWEAAHVRRSAAETGPSIVAAAASVIDDPLCREVLAREFVVWLLASPGTRAERMASSDHRRSLGSDPAAALAWLDARRGEGYGSVADLVIDTDRLTSDQIVGTVLDALPTVGHPGRSGLRS